MKMLVAGVLAMGLATAPTPVPDGLGQSLDPNQATASGRVVLEKGHVDIGPRYRDGRWTVQVHDGTGTPPVWRQPAEVVLRVRDAAVQRVPDDPTYAFLGQRPGTPVYVMPQTQHPDVVWLGWNTQDPGVMGVVQRGVTMNLLGVQGAGALVVYLQSGNLGAPQVLWNSAQPYPQPLWVDSDTHTHANWIFTRPGVYLVSLEITAERNGAEPVTARTVLRLAVGDATKAEDAFAAAYAGGEPAGSASPGGATGSAGPGAERSPAAAAAPEGGSFPVLPVAIGLLAVALAGTVGYVSLRQSRVRRRADAEHADTERTAAAHPGTEPTTAPHPGTEPSSAPHPGDAR